MNCWIETDQFVISDQLRIMDKIEKYDYIRFTLADFYGRSRGRVLPLRHAKKAMESGTSIFGGTLLFSLKNEITAPFKDDPQAERVPRANLIPDVSTLYPVTWCGGHKFKVAEVICESYWLKDKAVQLACPRYVARNQLQKLSELGLEILVGSEMEFMLRRNKEQCPIVHNYMSQREFARHSEFFFQMENLLYDAGVDIDSLHPEYDGGCFEVVLRPLRGILAADATFKFKNSIVEIADDGGYFVSFQSSCGNADNGAHFNHSLWNGANNNVFGDINDFSDILKHWLAGLLKHAKALTAFFSPTNNCYKRLHKECTPSTIYWGIDDRSACVKVKVNGENGVYLENRMPGSASNPYLVLAATVAAGMDGIVNKLQCPPKGELLATEKLPCSLSEAVRELKADQTLVDSLGREFVDWYVTTLEHDVSTATKDVDISEFFSHKTDKMKQCPVQ